MPFGSYGFSLLIEPVDGYSEFKFTVDVDLKTVYTMNSDKFEYGLCHPMDPSQTELFKVNLISPVLTSVKIKDKLDLTNFQLEQIFDKLTFIIP